MPVLDEDSYVRQTAVITLLWLVAMLVGGLLLLAFSDVFQGAY